MFTIRNLELNDYYNGFNDLMQQLTSSPQITFLDFKTIFDKLNKSNTYVYVVEEVATSKLIGTGKILIEYKFHNKGKSVSHIEDIVVDKNYRGHGIGKKIMEYLNNIAEKNKCYKCVLNYTSDNEEFYKKCDFKYKNIQMCKYY